VLAFHASHSATQEKEKVQKMKEQYGPLSQTPLAYLDRASSSWRTSQGCLLSEQPELLAILPAWGTTVDGELYEHQRPAHLTSASVGSALATPRAAMGDTRNSKPWVRPLDKPQNLENQIARLLPTPVVNDMGAGKTIQWWDDWVKKCPHGNSLSIEVQRLLPTPQSWDSKAFGPNVDWKKRAENHAASVASVLMNLPLVNGSESLDD
jgi:hypothetical protein